MAGLGLAVAVLFSAVDLGIATRWQPPLTALVDGARLDYGRGPLVPFAPLRAGFIRDVLGNVVPLPEGQSDAKTTAPAFAAGVVANDAPPRNADSVATPPRIVEDHELTNDDLGSARRIGGIPFTARTSTPTATREPEEPADCATAGNTVWYSFVPAQDRVLLASTFGTDHAVTLGVFTRSGRDMRLAGCDTDPAGNALVTFAAKASRTYYFQITARLTGGSLVFNLDPHGQITRATVSSSGEPAANGANGSFGTGHISADGRYVAFVSSAANFADGTGPGRCGIDDALLPSLEDGPCSQVYVRDRLGGRTTLVSMSDAGAPGDATSTAPFISATGRYVVFESGAGNLVPDDQPLTWDVFVHDRVTRRTERIPGRGASPHEYTQSNYTGFAFATISADGRYVCFQSPASDLVEGDTNGDWDAFVYDRVTGHMERVSVSTSGAQSEPTQSTIFTHIIAPSISADGRYVEFKSKASNLVAGDTNGVVDVFVRDRLARTTERVSVSSTGQQANGDSPSPQKPQKSRISADGRYVAFTSSASNLVDGDTNQAVDAFVHDRLTRRTVRASVSSSGEQGLPPLVSTDDERRAFFMDVSISADGRFVGFDSNSPNLAPGDGDPDPDVFLHDLFTRTTTVITMARDGGESHGLTPSVAAGGRYLAFHSLASNLVEGDSEGSPDIFVYEAPRA